MSSVIERFLDYVRFDTMSDENSETCPSTDNQKVLGAALVMGVRIGMKPVLAAIFGDVQFTNGIRYFLMAITASALWPMTFGFWSRLGRRQEAAE